MSWIYLTMAIVLEVAGTTCMKLAEGFTKPAPSAGVFVFYLLSLAALTLALKRIDVSVAYAVWSGLGTTLITLIGVAWFGEAITPVKAASIGLIVAGVVGLHLAGSPA